MCEMKTSLCVNKRSHSLQVQPGQEVDDGTFLGRSVPLLFFFVGDVGFFSPFSRLLIELLSLLLLLLFGLMELVGLELRGRLMPRFGGPSMVFKVPCMDLKEIIILILKYIII